MSIHVYVSGSMKMTIKEQAQAISQIMPSTPVVHKKLISWLENILTESKLPFNAKFVFWNQETVLVDGVDANRTLTITVADPGVVRQVAETTDPLLLIEHMVNGSIKIDGSMDDVVTVYSKLNSQPFNFDKELAAWCTSLSESRATIPSADWENLTLNSVDRDKAVIKFHYDVGNDFYKLWLDKSMAYSCAHWEREDMTLAEAQEAKIDLICKKLLLKPGEKLLDIGCGWGALIKRAATKYGVTCHGITLSQEQLEHNQKWIKEEGLSDKVTVELLHYRDLSFEAAFDKVSSVGMVEHVGVANYPAYFENILKALKPGGLFLNHGISVNTHFWPQTLFILRYVFPDGEAPHVTNYLDGARDGGFELVDVDCWRPHYGKTLRAWAKNLDDNIDEAKKLIGDRAMIWQFYLYFCAQCFEQGHNNIYQMLLRRSQDGHWNLPMTRDNWLS